MLMVVPARESDRRDGGDQASRLIPFSDPDLLGE
jgi:hypothetical protein